MAAPFPPNGAQQQYNEKPLTVYGEQYVAGQPPPIGATTDYGDPPLFTDGEPRVALPTGWVVVHVTDWVLTNCFTGQPVEVISDAEFTERFTDWTRAEAETPLPHRARPTEGE